VVDPLGLVVKGGIWYLVATTSGETRVYRVSRIRKLTRMRAGCARPRHFDLAAFWGRWARDFVASIPEYWVTLRVPRRTLPLLPQVFGERVRPAIEAGRRTKNEVTFELTFDSLESACGQLLRLGSEVEVMAPRELRAALRETAEKVARLYTRGTDRSLSTKARAFA
jgi:predicted DNA-binding transcriptional regulator YafY